MRGAVRGERERIGGRRVCRQRPRRHALPVRQIERQHLFERRADEPGTLERSRAQDEQAATPPGHEVRRHLQLIAAEEITLDVAEDHGVVDEQIGGLGGIPGRQGGRSARQRLNEKRVAPLVVLSFANDRIHLERLVACERSLEERVLEPGCPLDQQHPPPAALGGTTTLRVLFSVASSPAVRRNFHGIHRRGVRLTARR